MFHVGQHVLCIKQFSRNPAPRTLSLPIKGRVYVIFKLETNPEDGEDYLELEEIRDPGSLCRWVFWSRGFRPLSRDQIDQLLVVSRPVLEDA